jgi:hypothetical protein
MGEQVVLTCEVRSNATPRILARIANQVRGDRVHFNVPRRCQEIAIIHGKGSKSFLPQMPPPLFTEIDAPGVPPMCLANGTSKPLRVGGHGNEVNMVRHQAPGPDGDVIGTAPLRHQIDIGEVIVVAKKGLLTAIPPLGDVVWEARDYYSCDSCHAIAIVKPVL